MTTDAFVNPRLIRWAREREDLTQADVARRLNVKQERLEAWEEGTDRPTFKQAQTLAQKLGIPFGYLYLSDPPHEELALPDLRTVADEPARPPSPELSALLSDVLALQEWYRDYLEQEGAEPVTFIGRFSATNGAQPEQVAAEISTTFGVNTQMRERAGNWEGFLRLFVANSEAQGVMVLRSGVVGNNGHRALSVQEFRGFAISDDLAPLVFINGQDAKAAQIFTLAHEIAHLWLGESGISNPNYSQLSREQSNTIERVCNRIAAELLVPSEDFRRRWSGTAPIDENLHQLASHYRVSAFVVLRQAYDLQQINGATYGAHYEALLEESAARAQARPSGGNFHATLLARNSRTITTTMMSALAEGKILYRDAARLLNVKVSTLAGVSQYIAENAPNA